MFEADDFGRLLDAGDAQGLRELVGGDAGRLGRQLHLQTAAGSLEALQVLLDAGADVNFPDFNGYPPLGIALRCREQGVFGAVQLLLRAGASVNQACSTGHTPLLIASAEGRGKAVKLLLASGADVHAANDRSETPLHCACQIGHAAIGLALLAAGARSSSDKDGQTPLLLASQAGDLALVQALLVLPTAGDDVNRREGSGKSPAYFAASGGHALCLDALLVAGADASVADDDDWTPLCIASHWGHHAVVARLVVEPGLDLDAATPAPDDATALELALHGGHTRVAAKLVRAGAALPTSPDFAAALRAVEAWRRDAVRERCHLVWVLSRFMTAYVARDVGGYLFS